MNPTVEYREFGGHTFPYAQDTSALKRPVELPHDGITLKNSIVIQPLEGMDSKTDGTPDELTYRRYRRYFESGAGLVWFESLAVQEDGRSCSHAPWITDQNLDEFKRFVYELKNDHPDVIMLAQLTHSGRYSMPHDKQEPIIAQFNPHFNVRVNLPEDYPVATDEYLDRTSENFVHAAELCRQAGFDGVDVKGCHGYLFSDLLGARSREGRYGGSFENRSRMLLQTIHAIKQEQGSKLPVATRICHADTFPYPYGFGMKDDGSLEYDHTETIKLVEALRDEGVHLVNVSVGRVAVNPDFYNFPADTIPKDTNEDLFARFYEGTRLLAQTFPDMQFVGSGYALMRKDSPNVAAGVLEEKSASLIGFGRMAMGYPDLANALMDGTFDYKKSCTTCGNCYKLLRALAPTGCPTRDQEVYLPILRKVLDK